MVEAARRTAAGQGAQARIQATVAAKQAVRQVGVYTSRLSKLGR